MIVVDTVIWTLATETRATEPAFVGGREAKQRVDTAVYAYRMVCACGRIRYAKPNTLHEVRQCRLCQRETRLARRRTK